MARTATTPATDVLSVSYFDDHGTTGNTSQNMTYTREKTTRNDIVKTVQVNGWRPPTSYQSSGYVRGTYFVSARQQSYRASNPARLLNCDISGFSPLGTHNDAILQTESTIGSGRKNETMIRALKRIGDKKWNAGAALAEAGEAVGLIASSATKLARAMQLARAGQWGKLANHLGVQPKKLKKLPKKSYSRSANLASGWLQYNFGWAPIVDDMAQGLIYLSGVDEQTRFDISGHSRIQENRLDTSRDIDIRINGGYQQWLDVKGKRQVNVKDEYSVHLYYDVTLQSMRELERYGIIGLTTPWALKSMSFLADWVLPIGDFFQALDATIGATFKTGCTTSFQLCEERKPLVNAKWGETFVLKSSSASVEQSVVSKAWNMNRVVLTTPPVPLPLYIKDPLNAWRVVTACALFRQFKT